MLLFKGLLDKSNYTNIGCNETDQSFIISHLNVYCRILFFFWLCDTKAYCSVILWNEKFRMYLYTTIPQWRSIFIVDFSGTSLQPWSNSIAWRKRILKSVISIQTATDHHAATYYRQHCDLSIQICNFTFISSAKTSIASPVTVCMTLFWCTRSTSMGTTYIWIDIILASALTTE